MNLTKSFNMRGVEAAFESYLEQAITERLTKTFHYLEIGIGNGNTLAEVADYLLARPGYLDWKALGIDLANGAFFNLRDFIKRATAHDPVIDFNDVSRHVPTIPYKEKARVQVLLLETGEKRASVPPGSINFCLIDGCHGSKCVTTDFLSIEAGMAVSGIVAFHDSGLADQGLGYQFHCKEPIAVRQALQQLELIVPRLGSTRKGWRFIREVDGDKSPGNLEQNGNGMAFFLKE